MAKSAINLLQELTIKQGFLPQYDFMQKNINETSMQFTCHVSCKQLKAHGTGSSKKEAKHDAARKMLLLLDANNKVPLPEGTSSSSSTEVANGIQTPAKIGEMSSLCKQSIVHRNYIGMLQEFCQQQKIMTTDILYELVCEKESLNSKTFTMEVRVGSLRERATGYCKKTAKQEAAKKLLLRLNPAVADTLLLDVDTLDINDKETLENNIKKLGTEIIDCDKNKEVLPIAELSEKTKSFYLKYKSSDKNYKKIDQKSDLPAMKNLHTLFERNYSSKFSYSLRERMRVIRDNYNDQTDLRQIKRDIESLLKVNLQQITVCSRMKNHIICLRLLSVPCITQFGMGDTSFMAESRATYNLIKAILTFLNV